jgi:hypothetical protein
MFHRIESIRLERKRLKRVRKDLKQELTRERERFDKCLAREATMFFKDIYNDIENVQLRRGSDGFACGEVVWKNDIYAETTSGYVRLHQGDGGEIETAHVDSGGYWLEPSLYSAFEKTKIIVLADFHQWRRYRSHLNEKTLSFLFQSRVLRWISKELPGCWPDIIEGNLIKMI